MHYISEGNLKNVVRLQPINKQHEYDDGCPEGHINMRVIHGFSERKPT